MRSLMGLASVGPSNILSLKEDIVNGELILLLCIGPPGSGHIVFYLGILPFVLLKTTKKIACS